MDSLSNSTRPLKKNTNVPQLFHKIQREAMLPKSFYEASVTLIPKPNKDTHTHTHTHTKVLDEQNHRILNKIPANQLNTLERSYSTVNLVSSGMHR
jgi:hypothetical protein